MTTRTRHARVATRTLLLAGLLTSTLPVLAGCGGDPVGPPADSFSVLFVGNSLTYTNDLPGMVQDLFETSGRSDVFIASAAYPGWGLQDHWVGGDALERIDAGAWDVVILQQGPSATEGRPSLLEYSALFAERIRAGGGRPGLFMVWPAAVRDFDFDGVLDAYRAAAEAVDGYFFPAGEAWRVAWASDPELPLYGPDGFHPDVLGTYLAALVIFEQLSGTDPRALPPRVRVPGRDLSLDPERARLLQDAARTANDRHAR
jgi:hypothetical protein